MTQDLKEQYDVLDARLEQLKAKRAALYAQYIASLDDLIKKESKSLQKIEMQIIDIEKVRYDGWEIPEEARLQLMRQWGKNSLLLVPTHLSGAYPNPHIEGSMYGDFRSGGGSLIYRATWEIIERHNAKA